MAAGRTASVTYAGRRHAPTFFSQNYNTGGFWCAKAAFRFCWVPAKLRLSPTVTSPCSRLAQELTPNYKGRGLMVTQFKDKTCFFRASNPAPSYFQPGSSSLKQGKFYFNAKQFLPVPSAFLAPQELLSQRWNTADCFLHCWRATWFLLCPILGLGRLNKRSKLFPQRLNTINWLVRGVLLCVKKVLLYSLSNTAQ